MTITHSQVPPERGRRPAREGPEDVFPLPSSAEPTASCSVTTAPRCPGQPRLSSSRDAQDQCASTWLVGTSLAGAVLGHGTFSFRANQLLGQMVSTELLPRYSWIVFQGLSQAVGGYWGVVRFQSFCYLGGNDRFSIHPELAAVILGAVESASTRNLSEMQILGSQPRSPMSEIWWGGVEI